MCTRKLFAMGIVVGLAYAMTGDNAWAETKPMIDLKIGDDAPRFSSTDDTNSPWNLNEHLGKNVIVLYFYPADFTTGCTRQAEAWRDNSNKLSDGGIQIIGVSGDSVSNHKLFKETWKLNFTLLADEEASVAKMFGVPVRRGGRAHPRDPDGQPLLDDHGERFVLERKATFRRWTFVIDRDGKIVYKNTKVRPAKDSEDVLEFIQSLPAANPQPPTQLAGASQ